MLFFTQYVEKRCFVSCGYFTFLCYEVILCNQTWGTKCDDLRDYHNAHLLIECLDK